MALVGRVFLTTVPNSGVYKIYIEQIVVEPRSYYLSEFVQNICCQGKNRFGNVQYVRYCNDLYVI